MTLPACLSCIAGVCWHVLVNPGVISAVAEASGLVESSTALDGFEATTSLPQAAEAITPAATVVENSDMIEQEPEGRVQETAAVGPIGTQATTTPSVLDLTATSTNSGKTPAIIGVNLGHRCAVSCAVYRIAGSAACEQVLPQYTGCCSLPGCCVSMHV